jgi:hypothetical protein
VAILNGIRVAMEFAKAGINSQIEQELANRPAAPATAAKLPDTAIQ